MIAKGAQCVAEGYAPSFFYDSARQGMGELLTELARSLGRPPRVLLPAFIGWSPNEGSGVFDPVGDLGLEADFYDLHGDLQVDVADFERRLSAAAFDVVVLIHYFGRTQSHLVRLTEAARSRGALVVEDLAHGFFTARTAGPAGRTGDALMYSLHKMFPFPDGGVVVYRSLSAVRRQRSTRPELAARLLDYEWVAIGERRRANFLHITSMLRERADPARVGLLWPDLGPDDVPQTLPVRLIETDRDQVYRSMNAGGFGMVSLYHTLIPQLRARLDMVSLSRSIINFPVHQDVRVDQLETLVEAFRRAVEDAVQR